MKRTAFLILSLLASTMMMAQTIVCSSPDEQSQKLLDSVKYILPAFQPGTIVLSDGSSYGGELNIFTPNQKVHYTDPDGTTRELEVNDQVTHVSVRGRTFINCRYGYIEASEVAGEVVFGVLRSVNIVSEVKTGAYGSKSESTAIQTVGFVTDNGMKTDLNVNSRVPYTYKMVPYLMKGGSIIPANRKTFAKYFPQQKKFIEEYLKENRTDLDNVEQARAFFIILKKQAEK